MIHAVVGTKAQLIKMAPILKLLADRGIEYNYISTGQHRDTIDDILANFGIRGPDYSVYSGPDITSIPKMALWAARILWQTLVHRSRIFRGDRKGIVLVHGDTFSTLLGALMGKVAGLKVGHVESGLRSFNLWQPFPEELTRLATFALADFMFCPGPWAVENLAQYQGIKIDTGANTLLDALAVAWPAIEGVSGVEIPAGTFGIVTLHRFENFRTAEATERVVLAVERIARQAKLLFILHKPTEINLTKWGFIERLRQNPQIELRPRYDYFRFMKLIKAARFVVSDGGSNQEECYYLGKPVILLRNVSERKEGLGRNAIISEFLPERIDRFLLELDRHTFPVLKQEISPSERIVEACRPFAEKIT